MTSVQDQKALEKRKRIPPCPQQTPRRVLHGEKKSKVTRFQYGGIRRCGELHKQSSRGEKKKGPFQYIWDMGVTEFPSFFHKTKKVVHSFPARGAPNAVIGRRGGKNKTSNRKHFAVQMVQ